MELSLPVERGFRYKSGSQKSRVITEKWFADNMYCPACTSKYLDATPPNEKVVDFICPKCDGRYQMKGQGHPFGYRIMDSEYYTKIKAIKNKTIPNFVFMHYSKTDMCVQDLMIVPKHFISPEIIEKRRPLGPNARRAGWVGSNVLIGRLPLDAQVYFVNGENILPENDVRTNWKRFSFLKDVAVSSKGWLTDILSAVRKLEKKDFDLSEIYSFENELSKLHPDNRNIKPKIRQQLQFLRDKGVLEFVGEGRYRVLK